MEFRSLDFDSLKTGPYSIGYKKMWLYEIVNINNDKALFTNNKDRLFIFTNAREIEVVTNTMSISGAASSKSFQSSTATFISPVKQAQYLTNHVFDKNPRTTFYAITEEKLSSDEFLYDQSFYLANFTSLTDFEQHLQIAGKKSKSDKVRTTIELNDIAKFSASANSKPIVWASESVKSFSFQNNKINFENEGFTGNVEAVEIDQYGSLFEHYFSLDTTNKKYFWIQANANKTEPTINLQSDSFDTSKVMPWNFLATYFAGPATILALFGKFSSLANNFEKELYEAILTSLFVSYHAKSNFSKFRITDNTSQNFNAIDLDPKKLYGIAATEDFAKSPRDITNQIFSIWEGNFKTSHLNAQSELGNDARQLFQRIKVFMGMTGTLNPSQYAYGIYDDINELAFDFNFTYDPKFFEDIDVIKQHQVLQLSINSRKYVIDNSKQSVVNINDDWKTISQTKSFDLRNKYNLPNYPDRLIANDRVTAPSNVNLDTNDVFQFMWSRPLKNEYVQVFGTSGTVSPSVTTNQNYDVIYDYSKDCSPTFNDNTKNVCDFENGIFEDKIVGTLMEIFKASAIESYDGTIIWPFQVDIPSTQDKTEKITNSLKIVLEKDNYKMPAGVAGKHLTGIDSYISKNLIKSQNTIINVSPAPTLTITARDVTTITRDDGSAVDMGKIVFTFSWSQTVTIAALNIPTNNNKFPYNLNIGSLNNWKTQNGENDDVTEIVSSTKLTDSCRLKSLDYYTILSSRVAFDIWGFDEISSTWIKKKMELPTKFNFDQTVIRGGIDF